MENVLCVPGKTFSEGVFVWDVAKKTYKNPDEWTVPSRSTIITGLRSTKHSNAMVGGTGWYGWMPQPATLCLNLARFSELWLYFPVLRGSKQWLYKLNRTEIITGYLRENWLRWTSKTVSEIRFLETFLGWTVEILQAHIIHIPTKLECEMSVIHPQKWLLKTEGQTSSPAQELFDI